LRVLARRGVVLANGGAGRLWLRTSNPAGATADGLALAFGAGATLADLEFAQFHPTVLVPPGGEGEPFLVSEAVRGEGAYLRNTAGERFMLRYHPDAELAPRDVVARAILSEMLAADTPHAFLDLSHLDAHEVHARFPTIAAVCARYGLDLARDPIPVAPAAHYYMGGVAVDTWGRTTVPGLFAVGEVACTGVHGANRLASNSLLEGLVFGRRVARKSAESPDVRAVVWPDRPALAGSTCMLDGLVTPTVDVHVPAGEGIRAALRRVMWEQVSLARKADGLRLALVKLRRLASSGPVDPETANMLFAAQAITIAALARRESRGGHFRVDYPERDVALDGRHTLLSPVARHSETTRVEEGAARYANA
jgi:L-aspartate oxidase